MIEQLFLVKTGSIFSLSGQRGSSPSPARKDIAALPLSPYRAPFGYHLNLWWSSFYGHFAVEKLIVKPNSEDTRTLLMSVVETGNVAAVKIVLNVHGIEVDARDRTGRTPLAWATKVGSAEIVKLLLDIGKVDVNARDREGMTPLAQAVQAGQEATLKLLLETGKMDVNARNQKGRTPLGHATKNRQEVIVKLLLDTGKVDVNSVDDNGNTPTSVALYNMDEGIVELLLGSGKLAAETKVPGWWRISSSDQSAIHQAARRGFEAITTFLLGAQHLDPNRLDIYGRTPLHWAVRNGHKGIVRLLCHSERVDVNVEDGSDRTAYQQALEGWYPPQVWQQGMLELLRSIDRVNKGNPAKNNPLCVAVAQGNESNARRLLDAGVDVNEKNKYGSTPIWLAVEQRHEAMVKLLVDHSQVDITHGNMGYGALWSSSRHSLGHLNLDEPEVRPEYGHTRTPIWLAASRGYETIVRLLIKTGQINVSRNTDDQTALLVAASAGHENVVQLLLNTGQWHVEPRADRDWLVDALQTAIQKGLNTTVKQIVESGLVDLGVRWEDFLGLNKETFLHTAAQSGNKAATEILLHTGKFDADLCRKILKTWHIWPVCHDKDIKKQLETFVNVEKCEKRPGLETVQNDVSIRELERLSRSKDKAN